jgi:predicted metal-binding membrane protein
VPIAAGLALLIAGLVQMSAWKSRQLACCARPPACRAAARANLSNAWRQGVRLGLRCVLCCAPLMTVLVVFGVMDLRVMTLVTAAIAVERATPAGPQAARLIGGMIVIAGAAMLAGAG